MWKSGPVEKCYPCHTQGVEWLYCMTDPLRMQTYTGPIEVEWPERQNALFVLGRNGSGKSALLAHLHQHHRQRVRRVTAHRQTWFPSGRLDITSNAYQRYQRSIADSDRQPKSRYADDYSARRPSQALFALLLEKRIRDSEGIKRFEKGGSESLNSFLLETPNPLDIVNSLFRESSLDVKIATDREDPDALVATRISTGQTYGIEQLSDGERNALLLASEVLTAPEGTLLLLDEPERHLHRSIISPLLSGMFAQRPDCRFVISTHDLLLPQDCGPAPVLILRDCKFERGRVTSWDADLLESEAGIDDDLKIAIWGGRRTILCVEGTHTSRDRQIYESIFPEVSVWPMGNCVEVARFVRRAAAAASLHWLKVYGLIDRDSRTASEQDIDSCEHVYRLSRFAVESIYYDSTLQRAVAEPRAEQLGKDINAVLAQARNAGIRAVATMKSPTKREDQEALDRHVKEQDIDAIISGYPIGKSKIPTQIAQALNFRNAKEYEQAVRVMLHKDEHLRRYAAQMCGGLHTALQNQG